MNLQLNNRQRATPLNRARLKRLYAFLLRKAHNRAPDLDWALVSLVLVNDAQIRDVHKAHLGSDSVTDVISFRLDPIPGDTKSACGEILINVERAVQVGSDRRGGPARELALYLAHGLDHLSGATDNTLENRQRMRRRELRWLAAATDLDLIDGLILTEEDGE